MEACRACLATDKIMVPLDQPFVNAYNLLTNLNIALLDAMPQLVCRNCLECVKYCVDFRERCIITETSLQEIMLQKIKSEPDKLETEDTNVKKIKVELKEENFNEWMDDNDNFQDFDDDLLLSCIKQEKDKAEKILIKPKKRKGKKLKKKMSLKEKIAQLVVAEKFSCGLCNLQFSEKEVLKTHIESHKTSLKCGLCSEPAYNWPNLVGHRFMHISKKEQKCHICNKLKFSASNMEHHYMKEHFDGKKELLMCRHCNRTFDTPKKIKRHTARMHPVNPDTLICDYCSKTYSTKLQIAAHLKSVHGKKRTYVCDICGFSCNLSGGLQQHKIRKHCPNRVICKTCKRAFLSSDQHDKHKCGAEHKICPVCGKKITCRYKQHMAQHSGVKPYSCGRCGASFRVRGSLVAHLHRHDGVRPMRCDLCPLSFYTQSVLIKHRRVHTGEKPYVCKVCNKGFTGNHNLKVHMKVHGENLVVKRDKTGNASLLTFPRPGAVDQHVL